MKPRIKRAKVKSHVLEGADAHYNSLVDAGANQTPFTEIKAAKGTDDMAKGIKRRTKAKNSHVKVEGETPAVETKMESVVVKITYDVDEFETEEDVQAHLDKSDWEGDHVITFSDDEGEYTVMLEDTDEAQFSEIEEIEPDGEAGVKVFIGMTTAEDTDEDDEDDEDDAASADGEAETVENDDGVDNEGDPKTETKAGKYKKGKGKAKKADLPANNVDADEVKVEIDDNATGDSVDPALSAEGASAGTERMSAAEKFRQKALEKKASEKRSTEQKFSYYDAYYSGSDDFKEVMRRGIEGDNGTPPGMYELSYALETAVRNAMGGDDAGEKIQAAASDYANAATGLHMLFMDIVEAEDGEGDIVQNAVGEEGRERLVKWAEEFAVASDPEADHGDGRVIEVKAAKTTPNTDGLAELVKKSVEGAIGDIPDVLDGLGDQVGSLTATVEQMASRRQTSKVQNSEEGQSGGGKSSKTRAKKGEMTINAKGLMG